MISISVAVSAQFSKKAKVSLVLSVISVAVSLQISLVSLSLCSFAVKVEFAELLAEAF